MKDYIIFVDSACDISCDLLNKWGVKYCSLSLAFSGNTKEYSDHEIPAHEFYEKMRNGALPKTSAANMGKFYDAFEAIVKDGYDIMYLGFSSGLSATVNFAREAAEEIMSQYEGSKIVVVDSLCASAGYGLLVKLLVDKKASGASIDEVADFAENTKLKVCHWFTVDDLKYLKAGGRISATTALLGGMLNIKPVISVEDGEIAVLGKARGSKMGNNLLVQEIEKSGGVDFEKPVMLGYSGLSDALLLKYIEDSKYLWEKGLKDIRYTAIGSVIGTHAGPGAIAAAFFKK